jgi:hypothetical protein
MQLDQDLGAAGTEAAMALRKRHHAGEFDASIEESVEWANSAEGREAIGKLIRGE